MDIVDTTAIARRLDVQPGTVHKWRRRNIGFPEPVAQLAIGPVWEWGDVQQWAAQRRPQG